MSQPALPVMPFAEYFFYFFGAVSVIGGLIGFIKARSLASLIAGGGAGILLIAAGFLLRGTGSSFTAGEILALVISLLLLGRFTPALMRGKRMPAIYMVPLAAVGVILSIMLMSISSIH